MRGRGGEQKTHLEERGRTKNPAWGGRRDGRETKEDPTVGDHRVGGGGEEQRRTQLRGGRWGEQRRS